MYEVILRMPKPNVVSCRLFPQPGLKDSNPVNYNQIMSVD